MEFILIIIIIVFIAKRINIKQLQSQKIPYVPEEHFNKYIHIKIKRIDIILWTSIVLVLVGLPLLIYIGRVLKVEGGPILLIQLLQLIIIIIVSIWSALTSKKSIEKLLGKPENQLKNAFENKEIEAKQEELKSEEEKIEEDEKIKQESTGMLKGPLGCISTFIGVLIWGGASAIFNSLGLGGWSILIGLIIALIFMPFVDMGLRSLTGKK